LQNENMFIFLCSIIIKNEGTIFNIDLFYYMESHAM